MSSKPVKKSAPKKEVNAPLYRMGQKAFFVFSSVAVGSDRIYEGEIVGRKSEEYPEKDGLGKVRGYSTMFYYILKTSAGEMEIVEFNLFPSFQACANSFAQKFLTSLR